LKRSYYILILAFAATLLAVFLHEKNVDLLGGQFPAKNGMITTADEASYFQPAINYLESGEWKDYSIGVSSYVQRPPGYGGIYLIAQMISKDNPFAVMKTIQVLLFFFSILLFAGILDKLEIKFKLMFIITSIYALLPAYNGFMYYTLTEGVTPFLVLLLTYVYLTFGKDFSWRSVVMFSLAFFLITMVRPQLLILPLMIFVLLVYRNKKNVLLLAGFIPFILWQVRTHNIIGSWSLHPIYSSSNHSIFRPPHEAMTELSRIWEFKGDRFHSTIAELIRDTSATQRNNALGNVPNEFIERVEPVFAQFQLISMYQREQFETGITEELVARENRFVDEVKQLTSELAGQNIFMAYLGTPVKSGAELFTKSHMNLAVYQTAWRGNFLVELIRYLCLGLIAISFLVTFWYAVRNWNDVMGVFAVSILVTVLYLIFVQRLNEERYLTPLLPLALLTSVHGISSIKKGLTKSEPSN
jgi:hypothetical protein